MAEKIPTSAVLPRTDYTRWRLKTEDGRQTWDYLTTDEQLAAWPQSIADKYHLGLPTVKLLLRSTTKRNLADIPRQEPP